MKKNSKQSINPTLVSVRLAMPDGIYLSVYENDYFLSYNLLPWFRDAKLSDIFNVSMLGDDAIRWDNLDVEAQCVRTIPASFASLRAAFLLP